MRTVSVKLIPAGTIQSSPATVEALDKFKKTELLQTAIELGCDVPKGQVGKAELIAMIVDYEPESVESPKEIPVIDQPSTEQINQQAAEVQEQAQAELAKVKAAEAEVFVPSPANAPEGMVYCAVGKHHVDKASALPTSQHGVYMCKTLCKPVSTAAAGQAAAKARTASAPRAPKPPKTPRATFAAKQDITPLVCLPNSKFGVGDRKAIYDHFAAFPKDTVQAAAIALHQTDAFVRARVISMVADFKLAPMDSANEVATPDYRAFPMESTIKGVRDLVGEWTDENLVKAASKLLGLTEETPAA